MADQQNETEDNEVDSEKKDNTKNLKDEDGRDSTNDSEHSSEHKEENSSSTRDLNDVQTSEQVTRKESDDDSARVQADDEMT